MKYLTRAYLDKDTFYITCEGELYNAFKDLIDYISKEMDALPAEVTINLSNQTYLDSTAVGRLIKIQTLLHNEQKALKLLVNREV